MIQKVPKAGDMYVCMVITYIERSMDQPGKVANLARGAAEHGKIVFPYPRSCLRIWSRETGPVVVSSRASLLILHTQA